MHQVLIIAVFVIVFTHDTFGGALLAGRLSPGWVATLSLAPIITLWIAFTLRVRLCARAMDRTGSVRAIRRAEDAAAMFRWGVVLLHGANVFVWGAMELVRDTIGDLILIDDLLVLLIPISAMGAMHWSMYPIERRVREAVLFRRLEEGRPVHPFPTRWQYTWGCFRQSVLFMGAPLILILGWGEASDAVLGGAGVDPSSVLATGVQMVGVLGILILSPPIMRRMWDATPLGDGPLHAHLVELCERHHVRVRSILVWRTGGTIVNAAVLGLLARLRYIVLSDALIELLDEREVEAVAAHEIGHVRRKHVLWLGIAALGSVLIVSAPVGLVADLTLALTPLGSITLFETLVSGASLVVVFAGVIVLLGIVSRRFEWQADAFAAQHLSGMTRDRTDVTIQQDASATMASALEHVARLNGLDPTKFTWRHGSIRERQRRLMRLPGREADRLGVDRQARLVKALSLLALIAGAGVLALETVILP
ncbi:MAG: M48 family metallopeptidase [Phycisphaerales bacterium]